MKALFLTTLPQKAPLMIILIWLIFSFSDAYDENGYLKGITALDYVTLPDTESFTLSDDATTVSDSDIDDYISNNILPTIRPPTRSPTAPPKTATR